MYEALVVTSVEYGNELTFRVVIAGMNPLAMIAITATAESAPAVWPFNAINSQICYIKCLDSGRCFLFTGLARARNNEVSLGFSSLAWLLPLHDSVVV